MHCEVSRRASTHWQIILWAVVVSCCFHVAVAVCPGADIDLSDDVTIDDCQVPTAYKVTQTAAGKKLRITNALVNGLTFDPALIEDITVEVEQCTISGMLQLGTDALPGQDFRRTSFSLISCSIRMALPSPSGAVYARRESQMTDVNILFRSVTADGTAAETPTRLVRIDSRQGTQDTRRGIDVTLDALTVAPQGNMSDFTLVEFHGEEVFPNQGKVENSRITISNSNIKTNNQHHAHSILRLLRHAWTGGRFLMENSRVDVVGDESVVPLFVEESDMTDFVFRFDFVEASLRDSLLHERTSGLMSLGKTRGTRMVCRVTNVYLNLAINDNTYFVQMSTGTATQRVPNKDSMDDSVFQFHNVTKETFGGWQASHQSIIRFYGMFNRNTSVIFTSSNLYTPAYPVGHNTMIMTDGGWCNDCVYRISGSTVYSRYWRPDVVQLTDAAKAVGRGGFQGYIYLAGTTFDNTEMMVSNSWVNGGSHPDNAQPLTVIPNTCATAFITIGTLTDCKLVFSNVTVVGRGLFVGTFQFEQLNLTGTTVTLEQQRLRGDAIMASSLVIISNTNATDSAFLLSDSNVESNGTQGTAGVVSISRQTTMVGCTMTLTDVNAILRGKTDAFLQLALVLNRDALIKEMGSDPFPVASLVGFGENCKIEDSVVSITRGTTEATFNQGFGAYSIWATVLSNTTLLLSDVDISARPGDAPAFIYAGAIVNAGLQAEFIEGTRIEVSGGNHVIEGVNNCSFAHITEATLQNSQFNVSTGFRCTNAAIATFLTLLGTSQNVKVKLSGVQHHIDLNANNSASLLHLGTDTGSTFEVREAQVNITTLERGRPSLVHVHGTLASTTVQLTGLQATVRGPGGATGVTAEAFATLTQGATIALRGLQLYLGNGGAAQQDGGLPVVFDRVQERWAGTLRLLSSGIHFLPSDTRGFLAAFDRPTTTGSPTLTMLLQGSTLWETDRFFGESYTSTGAAVIAVNIESSCTLILGAPRRSLLAPKEITAESAPLAPNFFAFAPFSKDDQEAKCFPVTSTKSATITPSSSSTTSSSASRSLSSSESLACTVQLTWSPRTISSLDLRTNGRVAINVTVVPPPFGVKNAVRSFAPFIEATSDTGSLVFEGGDDLSQQFVLLAPLPLDALPILRASKLEVAFDAKTSFDCPVVTPGGRVYATVDVEPVIIPTTVKVVKSMGTAVAVAAVPSSVIASPTAAMQQVRMGGILATAVCAFAHNEPLDISLNPFSISVAPALGSYYRGTITGAVLLVIYLGVAAGLVVLVLWDPRKTEKSIWGSTGIIHVPGILVVPISFFLQPLATTTVALMIHGEYETDKVLGVGVWIGIVVIVGGCLYVTTRGNQAHTESRKEELEAEQVVVATSELGRLWANFFFSDTKWVNNDGTMGPTGFKAHWQDIFFNYRDGYAWYFALEITVSVLLGALEGIRLEAYCKYISVTSFVVLGAQSIAACLLRPFIIFYETFFHVAVSLFAALSACFAMLGLLLNEDSFVDAAGAAALLGLILNMMKAVFDILALLTWFYARYQLLVMRLNNREGGGTEEDQDTLILQLGDRVKSSCLWRSIQRFKRSPESTQPEVPVVAPPEVETQALLENEPEELPLDVSVEELQLPTPVVEVPTSPVLYVKPEPLQIAMLDSDDETPQEGDGDCDDTRPRFIEPAPRKIMMPELEDYDFEGADSRSLPLTASLEAPQGPRVLADFYEEPSSQTRGAPHVSDKAFRVTPQYHNTLALQRLVLAICRRQRNKQHLPFN